MKQVEIRCPNCGAIHTVELIQPTGYYLNGMHNVPMSKYTENMVLCKCGLLCTARMPDNIVERMKMQEYNDAIAKQYASVTEQKIALFNALYQAMVTPLYYAHYYDEIGNTEKRTQSLQEAIQNILTKKDNSIYNLHGLPMVTFGYSADLVLQPEERLVDLYRCAGDFDKAIKQIKYLQKKYRGKTIFALPKYLQIEAKLIRAKNNTFQ